MANILESVIREIALSSSSAFIPLPAEVCKRIEVLNNTGQTIDVRHDLNNVAGIPMNVKDGQTFFTDNTVDASEIWVKLNTGNTPTTLKYRVIA